MGVMSEQMPWDGRGLPPLALQRIALGRMLGLR